MVGAQGVCHSTLKKGTNAWSKSSTSGSSASFILKATFWQAQFFCPLSWKADYKPLMVFPVGQRCAGSLKVEALQLEVDIFFFERLFIEMKPCARIIGMFVANGTLCTHERLFSHESVQRNHKRLYFIVCVA